MIVSHLSHREKATWQVVTQSDHAAFAADLISLFRVPDLTEHPRRAGLLEAIREHDNGWRETDSMPYLDPGGRHPLGFRSVSAPLREEIWLRGAERFVTESPYLALLISQHALALHNQTEYANLYEALTPLREHCFEVSGIELAEIEKDYRWLAFADRCALVVAEQDQAPFEQEGFRVVFDGEQLRIDPFPLAGTTRCYLSCRFLDDRAYANLVELATELAMARWQRIAVPVAAF